MENLEQSQGSSNEPLGAGEEEGGQDWGEALAAQQEALQEQNKQSNQLRQELHQTKDVLGRVQKAFTGETDTPADPVDAEIAEAEHMLDYYLQQGIEAERKGIKIPLTILNGTKTAQLAIKVLNAQKKDSVRMNALETKVNRQADPQFQLTERAFTAIEGMLDEAVTQVYGAGKDVERTRQAQFGAVINMLGAEIKDLQRTDPDKWDGIRRNPSKMRAMVNYFVHQSMPPRVREMLADQQIQNEVMSPEELWTAFRQAEEKYNGAQSEKEERQWSLVMDDIRQQLIGAQAQGRRNGEKHSLNKVLGSYQR